MNQVAVMLCALVLLVGCKQVSEEHNAKTKSSSRTFIPEHDANKQLSTAEFIAYKNGLMQWGKVNEISFTFNVDRGANHFERSFSWNPKTQDVAYMTAKDTVRYNRNLELDSIQKKADIAFINDKYWLLSPYQLVWDTGTQFSEKENQIAPISKDTLNMLTVVYGNEGGYTPGDAYDFYFGNDYIIKEWVFRKGNQEDASMATTFEDYQDFNGLNLAKMHQDSTGGFKLHFTNITVK